MTKYRKGYKYQLPETITYRSKLLSKVEISTYYVDLTRTGVLTIRRGFAWDGASGLTIDSPSSITASAVHDALYYLIRQGLLPRHFRKAADEILRDLCIEKGMWKWRANAWYKAVRIGGKGAANPANKKKIYTAP